MFSSEVELSRAFKDIIPTSEWAKGQFWEEVKGLSGIPDFIILQKNNDEDIAIGIELKLQNWKRAMMQAFRYRTFCEQSYVILDNAHLAPALKKISDFKHFNIGLASIDFSSRKLNIHYHPKIEEPFSFDLKEKLIKKIG